MHKRTAEVVSRLARIEGHVRGLSRMVNENRPCDEVIHQIGALKAALNRVALIVLEDHLENCILGNPAGPESIRSLREAIEKLV